MLQQGVRSGDVPKRNNGRGDWTQPGRGSSALSYNLARLLWFQASSFPCSGSRCVGKPLCGLINTPLSEKGQSLVSGG